MKWIFLCLFSLPILAQNTKDLQIKRCKEAPKIDASFEDKAWEEAEFAENFIEFNPGNGEKEFSDQKTKVKMTYDDQAIYLIAYLYDNKPDKIGGVLTARDEINSTTDNFMLSINPLNNGQSNTNFVVTAAGVQADFFLSNTNGADFKWNAVWDSKTKITDKGWILELKIPYSALRFPKEEIQNWSVNFQRYNSRNRINTSWNYIDKTKGKETQYNGNLLGLKNIDPPTRLAFFPYVSTNNDFHKSAFNLGLDLKYGITDNFTLDATLIPDFSQASFDNVVLNLGPFENQFAEQRQFFIEGLDLFNIGNLFYSRRIGSQPTNYYTVYDGLSENQEVIDNPSKVSMLNGMKISGRTKKGLGVGVFNAITAKTEATIRTVDLEDSSKYEDHKAITEPLANYNIVALDQQFGNNSSLSFVNTNVTRNGSFRDANVSALVMKLNNKENTLGVKTSFKLSNVKEDGNKTGYLAYAEVDKRINAKNRINYSVITSNKKYDINDMGINFRTNILNLYTNYSYQIIEPTEKLNQFKVSPYGHVTFRQEDLVYTGNKIGLNLFKVNKKQMASGGGIGLRLGNQKDFFEPRVEGRFFQTATTFNAHKWFSSDYRKTFALDGNIEYVQIFKSPTKHFRFSLKPRYRVNDKVLLTYEYTNGNRFHDRGYFSEEGEDIIFGERNIKNVENRLSMVYNLNTKHSLSLSMRHYWSRVRYRDNFFTLKEDGLLEDNTFSVDYNADLNFNTWNLDLKYQWQFAPGSFLTFLYRNNLSQNNENSYIDYNDNVSELLKEDLNQLVSLKISYYLDYNKLKHFVKTI